MLRGWCLMLSLRVLNWISGLNTSNRCLWANLLPDKKYLGGVNQHAIRYHTSLTHNPNYPNHTEVSTNYKPAPHVQALMGWNSFSFESRIMWNEFDRSTMHKSVQFFCLLLCVKIHLWVFYKFRSVCNVQRTSRNSFRQCNAVKSLIIVFCLMPGSVCEQTGLAGSIGAWEPPMNEN